MGLLTGPKIEEEIAAGRIVIYPFDPALVNPNSVDLRLHPTLRVYRLEPARSGNAELDVAKDNPTEELVVPDEGLVLRPGRLYLGSSIEHLATDMYATVAEGKSSLGRLGLTAHVTAGFIDCGFRGTLTLEITVVHPLRIRPRMRICQICYTTVDGAIRLYAGKYQDQKGAEASRAWQDFKPGGTAVRPADGKV